MNNAHRNNILDKMDLLIASTDYHELMSLCLNQDIINDDMRAVIEVRATYFTRRFKIKLCNVHNMLLLM